MGLFSTKPFTRNDDIDGQGKDALLLAKGIALTNYELNRIYHEFLKYEDPVAHTVDIQSVFQGCKANYSLFCRLLFQIYDPYKHGRLNFEEFMVIIWAFLSAGSEGLARLCFQMFDVDRYY